MGMIDLEIMKDTVCSPDGAVTTAMNPMCISIGRFVMIGRLSDIRIIEMLRRNIKDMRKVARASGTEGDRFLLQ